MNADANQRLTSAMACIQKGNLPQAELHARRFVQQFGEHPDALALLGMIALAVNAGDFALGYLQRALQLQPGHAMAAHYLPQAQQRPPPAPAQGERFILIKAWGYGFWADVDHVIGQLMLAEMTGRTPVVHWGTNSLFRNPGVDDAFSCFFEPVSGHSLAGLIGKGYSFYPPKWSDDNLSADDVSKWSGAYSRLAGIYLLNREQDVIVSDFFTAVRDLVPWVRPGAAFHGWSVERIYRYLYAKYLRLQPHLQTAVERFWQDTMQGRELLAVHVRGSDKEVEMPDLEALNRTYVEKIDAYLAQHPEAGVFLLTDSSRVLKDYRQRYGDRLVVSPCRRTDSRVGLHYQAHDQPQELGNEVIIDACLAARCDAFIGNGFSNVSQAVMHLKSWDAGQCTLLGQNMAYLPNFYLHDW